MLLICIAYAIKYFTKKCKKGNTVAFLKINLYNVNCVAGFRVYLLL